MTIQNIPREVARGKIKLGELEIEVIQLDNGQRIISQESMKAFTDYMVSASLSEE